MYTQKEKKKEGTKKGKKKKAERKKKERNETKMDQKQKNAHGAGQVSRERPTRPHGTPRYTVVPVIHPVGTREKKKQDSVRRFPFGFGFPRFSSFGECFWVINVEAHHAAHCRMANARIIIKYVSKFWMRLHTFLRLLVVRNSDGR